MQIQECGCDHDEDFIAEINKPFPWTLEPPVKIVVGEGDKQETHYVSPSLLIEKSGYFRGCLQSQCLEASNREIRLPDQHALTFQYFLKWLYTGDFDGFHEELHLIAITTRVIDLYILGDRLLCTGLKDRSMDILQECTQGASEFIVHDLSQVVSSGLSSSKLWKYCVERAAFLIMEDDPTRILGNDTGWREFAASAPGFVTDVLEAVVDWWGGHSFASTNRPTSDSAKDEGCKWHEHGEEEECKAVRRPRKFLGRKGER